MRQFNSITIEQYNNKKIASRLTSMRFSVVREALYTFLYHKKGVTLLELLIAVSIFGLIVIGFSSIDTFSRYHVITSDRKAKLQNDASYVLEHMAKEIGKAIGNRAISAQDPIDLTAISGDTAIRIYVDLDSDGQSPGDGKRGTGGDRWRAYRFTGTVGSNKNQIWYYPNYVNPGSSYEILSRSVATFFTPTSTDNYVDIQLAARWQPDQAASMDNPEITLRNRINMPAVSTN